ncbi:MAG: ACT domain-containing protein, partial [Anaerolineaceae bacterium]|nr:ACT domain-containing protein [Anaerolineaceae bacterium]
MSFNLTLSMDDRPGAVADLGIALGKAGINVEGICAYVSDGKATIHILVEDAATSRQVLEKLGIVVKDEPKVLVIPIQNRPGEIGQLCRRLANAGI